MSIQELGIEVSSIWVLPVGMNDKRAGTVVISYKTPFGEEATAIRCAARSTGDHNEWWHGTEYVIDDTKLCDELDVRLGEWLEDNEMEDGIVS